MPSPLFILRSPTGQVAECSPRCYTARTQGCSCRVCGGMNHGAGAAGAVENLGTLRSGFARLGYTVEMVEQLGLPGIGGAVEEEAEEDVTMDPPGDEDVRAALDLLDERLRRSSVIPLEFERETLLATREVGWVIHRKQESGHKREYLARGGCWGWANEESPAFSRFLFPGILEALTTYRRAAAKETDRGS